MSEFIEIISPKALEDLKKANTELAEMVKSVKTINQSSLLKPSSVDANVKKLNNELLKQEKILEQLAIGNERVRQAELRTSIATNQLAASENRLAVSSNSLTKSNNNLKKSFNEVGNNLKNLVAQFGLIGGIAGFAMLIKNIYTTTKELQSLDLALKMVSGSQKEFASNQAFLMSLSNQYGIEIKGLTKNFTEFWVASKGKLESTQIKDIFTSISKSVAVMGLSVEQQDSAFLALQQMMSKGTVQAEELKKQLGNALPGAVKAATMAYQSLHPELKVTEKLFMEQMKAGKVLSSELLPELAKAYEKLYGIENVKRAETLIAAQERLSNSWVEMIRAIELSNGETIIGRTLKGATILAQGFLDVLTKIVSTQSQINNRNVKSNVEEGRKSFNEDVAGLKGEELRKKAIDLNRKDYADYVYMVDKVNRLNKELNDSFLAGHFSLNLKAELEGANKSLGYFLGRTMASSELFNKNSSENTKATEEKTKKRIADEQKAREENNKEIEKEEQLTTNSQKAIDKNIQILKEQLSNIDKTTAAYELLNNMIKLLEVTTDNLGKNTPDLFPRPDIVNADNGFEFPNIEDVLDVDAVTDYTGKIEEARLATEAFSKSFLDDFIGESGLESVFAILNGDLEKYAGNWKVQAQLIMEAAQEMYNFLNQQSAEKFDAEYERLEKQRDDQLIFAGNSAAAKEKIELEYERKRREIANREAKAKKQQAIFNIAIDTAQAVVATFAELGWPAGIVGAAIVAALGAAQIAMVASQKLPEYWKGTDNADGGLAWTQERGAEIITDKKGNIKTKGTSKGAQLTMLDKGDKVYTASETKQMLFDNELNSIMSNNGIGSPNIIINKGISADEMRVVLQDTLGSMPKQITTFDNNGFTNYLSKGGNITRRTEIRANGIGIKF